MRLREAKIAAKIDLTTEPSFTEKPVVVWMKPRKQWQQGLFSPLLWGKWMVHLALVIIALSTGFYAAQYQHRITQKNQGDLYTCPYLWKKASLLSSESDRRPISPSRVVYPEHPVSAKARIKKIDVEKNVLQTDKHSMADAEWKLIGTMVADPAEKSIAVIEYLGTQVQDTVNEGDRAGGLRIKKIMRDRIIVDAGDNDVMVAMNRTLPAVGQESIAQSTMALAQATAATSNDDYSAGRDLTHEHDQTNRQKSRASPRSAGGRGISRRSRSGFTACRR